MFRWLPYEDELPWMYRTPDGSFGLQEMLELIYAPNAVVHMLSGKAIA